MLRSETCANCSAIIGDLETPSVWNDHVVCATCYARLSRSSSAIPRVANTNPSPSVGSIVKVVIVVLGVLLLIVVVLAVGLAIIPNPKLNSARETVNRMNCSNNMRQIGLAIYQYAEENGRQYPPDLGMLIKTQDIPAEVFTCRSGNTKLPNQAAMKKDQIAQWVNDNSDYVYIGQGKKMDAGAEQVVLYERSNGHDSDGMNMLYGDGHVEFNPTHAAVQQLKQQGIEVQAPSPP